MVVMKKNTKCINNKQISQLMWWRYCFDDGTDILLKDDGTEFGRFKRDSSDFVIKSETNNKDIVFRGQDGGGTIT